jgi:hypothetical protein
MDFKLEFNKKIWINTIILRELFGENPKTMIELYDMGLWSGLITKEEYDEAEIHYRPYWRKYFPSLNNPFIEFGRGRTKEIHLDDLVKIEYLLQQKYVKKMISLSSSSWYGTNPKEGPLNGDRILEQLDPRNRE